MPPYRRHSKGTQWITHSESVDSRPARLFPRDGNNPARNKYTNTLMAAARCQAYEARPAPRPGVQVIVHKFGDHY